MLTVPDGGKGAGLAGIGSGHGKAPVHGSVSALGRSVDGGDLEGLRAVVLAGQSHRDRPGKEGGGDETDKDAAQEQPVGLPMGLAGADKLLLVGD
jgi:hypothetical protein